MFGHTPPAVIAIDPERMVGCAAMQDMASALTELVLRRPACIVVSAPASLRGLDAAQRGAAMEPWHLHPADAPEVVPDADVGMAQLLAEHLRHAGAALPVRPLASTHPHAGPSGIYAGALDDAARLAIAAGAPHVEYWSRGAAPAEMGGVPVVVKRPRSTASVRLS